MNWFKVEISAESHSIDIICGMLVDLGISGVEVVDRQDFVEFINDNNKQWDFVDDELMTLVDNVNSKIICYLPNNQDGIQLIDKIKSDLNGLETSLRGDFFGKYDIDIIDIGEDSWTDSWKKYYKPIEIGEKLLINPVWEEIPETERVILKMNPGNMFGTGAHQSTQLCLEFIEKYLEKDDRIFDVGCGSGILAIAAMLLGARNAVAVDIDPNVSAAVSENIEYNQLDTNKFSIYNGNILEDLSLIDICSKQKYDFVFANIVADVIIEFLSNIKKFIIPGGKFVCSGVINDRKEDVIEAIEAAGLKVLEVKQKDDWVSIMCKN